MKNKKRLASGNGFAFDLETKKNLGQNFLADKGILAEITAHANQLADNSGRNCLEIGPGSGALTRCLLESGWKVWAVEKDPRAVQGLRESLGREFPQQLTVLDADILKFDPATVFQDVHRTPLCIGNIPYYITSDILFWFLRLHGNFSAAILMVQNEVADRLCSAPGSKDYGRLTVRTQLTCAVEKLLVAPAKAFVPPPKVDSAVVELRPLATPLLREHEDVAFAKFTASLFSARRKMLRKTVLHLVAELHGSALSAEEAEQLESLAANNLGVGFNQRPEEISPRSLLELFRLIRELPSRK